MLRTPINFAAIYADAGKKAEAYTAAAAIVGFSGMEPLIRLTQTVILIVWSVAESLLDVAGMINGKNVPIVKNSKNIVTTFSEIFQLQGDAIVDRTKRIKAGTGNSAGYEEYLQLFLSFSEKSVCNYRLMDLIEWDMRKNGYPNFTIGSSVYAIRVKGIASFPSRFFRMSPLEQLLGRSLKDFQTTCERLVSY